MTRPLDPKTLRRLVELIVDDEGAFERKGWQLEELLRNARWDDPPEYDGTPRVPWLLDVLSERPPDDVERLIRRVCMPVEYEDGKLAAEMIRTAVNDILALEGLIVADVSGHPVLTDRRPDDDQPVYSAPDDLDSRLPRLIGDDRIVKALITRADEAAISERHGAYALAVIGIGSFLEGLLHAVLYEHDPKFQSGGSPKASLHQLIESAHGRQWIHLDARDFANHVRDYRNFVHLRHQMERGLEPDGDTVMLCWGPVQAVLNDLETALSAPDQSSRNGID